MKIHDVQQGTTAWLELRAGIPTASQFDKILTAGGKPSQSAEKYMLTLLAERLMGHPIVEHMTMWMERGSAMEQDAVAFYELQSDADTIPVGFVTNDDETIGASPDRFVGEDGLLEIKCPSDGIHMGYLLKTGSHYDAYKVQCQGQLMVTGRKWTDILSFHPELPRALHRVERDEAFIEKLDAAVSAFSRVLEEQFTICVSRGWVAEKPAPVESARMTQMRTLEELLKLAGTP